MKVKFNKKIFLLGIVTLLLLIVLALPTKVEAVLQSNGDAAATKSLDTWILQIRQMQSAGGCLGLSDTINTTGLLSNNKNLDIHMEKNTEYGAMILLSASDYGNPNKIAGGQTTTGNNTGAIMNISKEWVAAGAGLTSTTNAKNANVRYINNDYGTTAGGKYHAGDAMNIGDWHSSGASTWFYDNRGSGLIRAYSGSVFSYYGDSRSTVAGYAGYEREAYYPKTYASRAAIVVASGI